MKIYENIVFKLYLLESWWKTYFYYLRQSRELAFDEDGGVDMC